MSLAKKKTLSVIVSILLFLMLLVLFVSYAGRIIISPQTLETYIKSDTFADSISDSLGIERDLPVGNVTAEVFIKELMGQEEVTDFLTKYTAAMRKVIATDENIKVKVDNDKKDSFAEKAMPLFAAAAGKDIDSLSNKEYDALKQKVLITIDEEIEKLPLPKETVSVFESDGSGNVSALLKTVFGNLCFYGSMVIIAALFFFEILIWKRTTSWILYVDIPFALAGIIVIMFAAAVMIVDIPTVLGESQGQYAMALKSISQLFSYNMLLLGAAYLFIAIFYIIVVSVIKNKNISRIKTVK